MKKNRILEIESLRGIMSIIIAFFMHYNWLMTSDYPIKALSIIYEKGYYVVETFFVLSGFGMALGYADKLRNDDNANIVSFLWNRMKKIWPIMTLALFVTTLLQFVHFFSYGNWYYVSQVTIYSFVLSLLNIASGWFVLDLNLNMPLWYLSGLMLDYVIYYVICKISKKDRGRYLFLILAVAFGGLAIVITGRRSDQAFTYYNIARGHACFFVGCILKEIYDYVNVEESRSKIANICAIILVVITAAVVITGSETKVLADSQWLSQMIWGNVLSPMLIWVCMFCKPVRWLLQRRPFIIAGGVSTSIYIWHFPCYQLIRILSKYIGISQFYSKIWFYLLIIVYIFGVALVSNKVIEPILNKKTEEIISAIHQE